jgi:hypothetical protein
LERGRRNYEFEIFREDIFEDYFYYDVGGFSAYFGGNGRELAGGEGFECSAGFL